MAQQNEIGLIQFIKKSREKICLNMKIIKKNIKSRQNKNYFNSYNLYSNIVNDSNTIISNRSSLKNFEWFSYKNLWILYIFNVYFNFFWVFDYIN